MQPLKWIIGCTLILTMIIMLLLVSGPYRYLPSLLLYQKADLDDYQIFNNRVVAADNVIPWPKAQNYNQVNLSDEAKSVLGEYDSKAFLIIKNGELLLEKYWQGYDEHIRANSFSMAKSIVSLLVGIAISEGHIRDLEQKLSDFLPAFSQGQRKHISIKDVLTMSSGLSWEESYSSPFSVTAQAYYGQHLVSLVNTLQVSEQPGLHFHYASINTQILAEVLEKATGITVSDYASTKLWQPIGANQPALWSLDQADGEEKAFCCFFSSARDFARIGQLILNEGLWQDKQVIPRNYLLNATQPAKYLKGHKDDQPVDFYGYHFWLTTYENKEVIVLQGIKGQYILVIPAMNTVVVRLGEKKSSHQVRYMADDLFKYLDITMSVLNQ
ncbi:serine hydrolase domain-containing protein [Zooshikella ganghwensis]|uniref:Class C beta-lactamase-related serine hydrolase n=2 Tax=Zooshikella ganghwensis TaxID=202772 RepID=A0A4P9VQ82_9GAMM|nr:serine hydrolase [Zooshikella ganghwensis]RDH44707.1 class C beta-lactamase-related serine hydrolase [Zooshikella ganghwensis]